MLTISTEGLYLLFFVDTQKLKIIQEAEEIELTLRVENTMLISEVK